MQALLAEVEAAQRELNDELCRHQPGTATYARLERLCLDLDRLQSDVRAAMRLGIEGEISAYRTTLDQILAESLRPTSVEERSRP